MKETPKEHGQFGEKLKQNIGLNRAVPNIMYQVLTANINFF